MDSKTTPTVAPTFQNYIFDFDGTVIDSSGDIFDCTRKTFQLNQIALPAESLHSKIIGPPLIEMIRGLCPDPQNEELVQKLTQNYREFYDQSPLPLTQLYPQVKNTLLALKEKGKKIFIATNKRLKPTLKIIHNLEIDFFDEVTTPDFHSPTQRSDYEKKDLIHYLLTQHKLLPQQTLMVGDTINDLLAAQYHQVPVAIVKYGYGDLTNILPLNPKYLLDRIEQILAI